MNQKYEGVLVWSVMTLIFLPVRLVFYTFVSNNWYGSFGLMSVVSIILIILVRKNKLGFFGVAFTHQMQKIQQKRRKFLVYGFCVFNIFLLLNFIIAINLGDSQFKGTEELVKQQMINNNHGNDIQLDTLIQHSQEYTLHDYLMAFVGIFLIYFTHYDVFSAFMGIENQITSGLYLHMSTVFFIEQLEVLGILLFYRRMFKKDETQVSLGRGKGSIVNIDSWKPCYVCNNKLTFAEEPEGKRICYACYKNKTNIKPY